MSRSSVLERRQAPPPPPDVRERDGRSAIRANLGGYRLGLGCRPGAMLDPSAHTTERAAAVADSTSVKIRHDDASAVGAEQPGGRGADALPRARHDRHLALEQRRHRRRARHSLDSYAAAVAERARCRRSDMTSDDTKSVHLCAGSEARNGMERASAFRSRDR